MTSRRASLIGTCWYAYHRVNALFGHDPYNVRRSWSLWRYYRETRLLPSDDMQ